MAAAGAVPPPLGSTPSRDDGAVPAPDASHTGGHVPGSAGGGGGAGPRSAVRPSAGPKTGAREAEEAEAW